MSTKTRRRSAARAAMKAAKAVVWQTVDVTVAVKAGEPFIMEMAGAEGWVMCMDSDGRWGVTHAPTGLRLTTLPCPIQALAVVQALAVNAPLPEAPPPASGETTAWGASVTRRVSDVLRGVSSGFSADDWPEVAQTVIAGLMNGAALAVVQVPVGAERAAKAGEG